MATSKMLRLVTPPILLCQKIASGKPRLIVVALIVFALTSIDLNRAGAQTDLQPYMVYVDQEEVSARCGPGGDYYRTDPLRHGQALEVYVETEDGWLGIRPPEDSFCWLPADVVKLSPNQDYGIVTENNALAWIGTHLGKANKYLWQVQLSEGEEVAILGRAKREGPDGMKLWFRIVPPAGEFRWVHREQVVDNPEMLLRDKPEPGSRLANAQPTLAPETDGDFDSLSKTSTTRRPLDTAPRSILQRKDAPEFVDNELHPIEADDKMLPLPIPPADRTAKREQRPSTTNDPSADAIGSGLRQADNDSLPESDSTVAKPYEAPLVAFMTRPTVMPIGQPHAGPTTDTKDLADSFDRRTAPRQTPAFAATYDSRDRERELNRDLSRDRALVDQSRVVLQPTVMPVLSTQLSSSLTNRSIDGLQLELSRLMSRSARASELESVVAASTQHAQSNPNESERMRASMLIQRAREYQAVALRRDGETGATPTSVPAVSSYPEPVLPTAIPAMPATESPQDDATGYLVQVFSARPDSPPFALTDKRGMTTFYVSPAPGVNVRRFLNQFVNIRGTAGYSTGLDTPHIIATGAIRVPE